MPRHTFRPVAVALALAFTASLLTAISVAAPAEARSATVCVTPSTTTDVLGVTILHRNTEEPSNEEVRDDLWKPFGTRISMIDRWRRPADPQRITSRTLLDTATISGNDGSEGVQGTFRLRSEADLRRRVNEPFAGWTTDAISGFMIPVTVHEPSEIVFDTVLTESIRERRSIIAGDDVKLDLVITQLGVAGSSTVIQVPPGAFSVALSPGDYNLSVIHYAETEETYGDLGGWGFVRRLVTGTVTVNCAPPA